MMPRKGLFVMLFGLQYSVWIEFVPFSFYFNDILRSTKLYT